MKKLLLVFDLNKTLCFATKSTKKNLFLKERQSEKYLDYNIFFRGGRNEFLDFLFRKNESFFQIGVWSSLDREKTSSISKLFFDRYFRKLLFVAGTNREDYEGNKKEYDINPIKIKRNLGVLTEKYTGFEENNIVVISNYNNLLEKYNSNDLILPLYSPEDIGDKFETDYALQTLMKYLHGVKILAADKGVNDIRSLITAKSFKFMHERIESTNIRPIEFY